MEKRGSFFQVSLLLLLGGIQGAPLLWQFFSCLGCLAEIIYCWTKGRRWWTDNQLSPTKRTETCFFWLCFWIFWRAFVLKDCFFFGSSVCCRSGVASWHRKCWAAGAKGPKWERDQVALVALALEIGRWQARSWMCLKCIWVVSFQIGRTLLKRCSRNKGKPRQIGHLFLLYRSYKEVHIACEAIFCTHFFFQTSLPVCHLGMFFCLKRNELGRTFTSLQIPSLCVHEHTWKIVNLYFAPVGGVYVDALSDCVRRDHKPILGRLTIW